MATACASLLHRAPCSSHTRKMPSVPKKHEVTGDLLDSLSEALVVLDPGLEVLEWNASMEHLTGVPRADAVGRRADTVLPLFSDALLASLVRRAASGETPETIELPHTTPGDDRSRWLEARCVPWRDDAGRVAGVPAVFTDVINPPPPAPLPPAMEDTRPAPTSSP